MNDFTIYLSGGMQDLSLEASLEWRNRFEDGIKLLESTKNVKCFSPPKYYAPQEPDRKTEKEVFEFDKHQLKQSDLVVAYFNVPKSIGTAMELAWAKDWDIPVIGICEKDEIPSLHTWLAECVTRFCNNIPEAISYINDYYLT